MKLGGIYVSVGAKTSKLKRDLAKAKGMTEKTAVLMKKAISQISFAKVGVAAAAFSAAYVYGMKKAIDAASDLQEVQGKFDVVFQNHKDQAEEMAKVLVDSYAMSTREAKQYMSSIQDLLVPMGMMADKALLMSNEVVKLAADLGSFNNLPTATVMLDIQSALVGNFETMKKYGVILNETVIKQKALEMGLWSGKGMVDANTKAQIAYKLMLEGSAAAIGDQERTMGSYANQMKLLKANIEDVAAAIGNKLLPRVTEWVNQVNVMIKQNPELIDQMGDIAEGTLVLASGITKIVVPAWKAWMLMLDATGVGRVINLYRQYLELIEKTPAGSPIGEMDFDAQEASRSLNRYKNLLIETTDETKNLTLSKKELERAAKALAKADLEEAEAMAGVYQRQFDVQMQYYTDSLSAKDKYAQMMTEFDMELRDLELQSQIDHAKKMADVDKKAADEAAALMKSRLQTTASFFGDMAGLMGQFSAMMIQFSGTGAEQSKKDFERQKKLNIAQTNMSTAAGIAKVLAEPGGYLGIAMGVIIGAIGAVQIATIDKQEYQYAKGGVFTNSVVDRPTMFNNSVMGEAGPEAIIPLAKGPGGELGVKSFGGNQPTINHYYNINAIDARSLIETMRRTPEAITLPLNEQMQRGNSTLNSNIRRVAR